MRKSVIFIILILTATAAAQTGHSFLARLPELPGNPCSMAGKQSQEYLSRLDEVMDELDAEISKRRKEVKKQVEEARPEIEKQIAQEYGLSASDVQKLKNKKMSKEEKRAIADRMMQEKAGISMNQIEKLKNMSKEGKKAWAQSYATQQQANLSGNPDSNKTPEQIEMEKNLVKNKRMADLAAEQARILKAINASDKVYTSRMIELDKKDSVASKELKEINRPLIDKLNALPGPTEEEASQIIREIVNNEKAYCFKLTPELLDILNGAYISLQTMMDDYARLEEINAELNKSTLKIDKGFSSPGLMQLEAVSSYAHRLHLAFKYSHYSYPDPAQVSE